MKGYVSDRLKAMTYDPNMHEAIRDAYPDGHWDQAGDGTTSSAAPPLKEFSSMNRICTGCERIVWPSGCPDCAVYVIPLPCETTGDLI